jgi:DNA (cytosine-5)-methyltransferase 1
VVDRWLTDQAGDQRKGTLRCGALFAGVGALELAVGEVLGARPVWFVENNPAASMVLAQHWPEVPNFGDITTVDWDSAEPIDILTGGFPCTDVSSAGKRAGLRPGTRSGLWSHMAYAISQLRPKLVIIENVRGLLSTDAYCDLEPCPWCVGDNEGRPLRALGAVLGELASLGYVGRWHGLRASDDDVGAPHGRFRVFIVACPARDPDSVGGEGWPPAGLEGQAGFAAGFPADPEGVGWGEGRSGSAGVVGGSGASFGGDGSVAYSCGPGWGWDRQVDVCGDGGEEVRAGQTELGRRDSSVAYPDGPGWGQGSGVGRSTGAPVVGGGCDVHSTRSWVTVDGTDYGPAVRRWESILGRAAPDPVEVGKRGGHQLSPRFTEWLMGWPLGWVTGVAGLSRADQVRVCGNGVVPAQAVVALRFLLSGGCPRIPLDTSSLVV